MKKKMSALEVENKKLKE